MPARVILQDFTGVPAVVDLAAMRAAVKRLGGDPKRINPLVPVDLVIDHSVQVDAFGTTDALRQNAEIEFERNRERYEFLRWGQQAFQNFRVVPPATGIVHQVNLEYLAKGVLLKSEGGESVAMPDTLVGTDSHTTMINGLGVLGWGVGGIEAEAAMLGQPLYMVTPQVVGFRLTGRLREGATATDLVLTVTQMLRKKGVVEKFVEFYGPGLAEMSLADRATIANMAPEYGATCGFFPVDDETLATCARRAAAPPRWRWSSATPRSRACSARRQMPDPVFTDTLELDLATVEPSLAGPKRPQDRVPLSAMKSSFQKALTAPVKERGFGLAPEDTGKKVALELGGKPAELRHGAVVIAAITSCTNTSNPSVMLAAGLLARKAVRRGLRVPPYVKTSLAPGSKVVTEYLRAVGPAARPRGARLPRGRLRLHHLHRQQRPAAARRVEGGQRGQAGRRGRAVRQPQLRGPRQPGREGQLPGLAAAGGGLRARGHDRHRPRHGADRHGRRRRRRQARGHLAEPEGGRRARGARSGPRCSTASYGNVFDGNPDWNAIPVTAGDLYAFREDSTYIQEPPFFQGLAKSPRRSPTSWARACWRCSATRSRPTTSRPPATSPSPLPPGASWGRTGSRRRTSTPTARAAATTG